MRETPEVRAEVSQRHGVTFCTVRSSRVRLHKGGANHEQEINQKNRPKKSHKFEYESAVKFYVQVQQLDGILELYIPLESVNCMRFEKLFSLQTDQED